MMGTILVSSAVRGEQVWAPTAAEGKNGEMLVFDHEFTWKDEKPFFCWSPFAPGLNRPGLRGVKRGIEEPPYEPFDSGGTHCPDSWTAPHDYWNGTWQFRYQLKNRTSERPGFIHMGIWSEMRDHWATWKEMTSPKVRFHGKSGTFFGEDGESPASTWWRKEKDRPVDFSRTRDITFLGFIMWNDRSKVLHPAKHLGEQSGWHDSREDYFPCTVKATVVAVPAGRKFSGWSNYA